MGFCLPLQVHLATTRQMPMSDQTRVLAENGNISKFGKKLRIQLSSGIIELRQIVTVKARSESATQTQ
jgi:hypothetical protein